MKEPTRHMQAQWKERAKKSDVVDWKIFMLDTSSNGSEVVTGNEATNVQRYMFDEGKEVAGVCNIPKLKPFHPSIEEYISTIPANISCVRNKKYPLIFETDLVSTLIQLKDPQTFGFRNCCYTQLLYMNTSDNYEKFDKRCIPITKKETKIPSDIDFFKITCTNTSSTNKSTKYAVVDMFAFARLTDRYHKRMKKIEQVRKEQSSLEKDKLNVVILGLDGVSHMNFQRIMSKSLKFLINNLTAIGLNGYVKTGDNTYPNMASILMGLNHSEIEYNYWNGSLKYFDELPLVWKEYEDQGYVTSFGEDSAWMGVFIYNKKGFKRLPVDMYLRPITRQMSKKIGHEHHGNSKLCYASRMSIDILFDYMKKTATLMKTVKKQYFQLIWASALFHDDIHIGQIADTNVLNHLQWFLESGNLNRTILILMSDHGSRFGSFRKSTQGKIEERMPFLYFIFPSWFRKKYKLAVENLRRNEQMLTSHFDLHQTLRDFINTNNITDENIKIRTKELNIQIKKGNVSRGISLLLPIQKKRTCEDAGIPDRWCVCFKLKRVKVDDDGPNIVNAALVGVKHMNKLFKKQKVSSICHKLKLYKVSSAENIILNYQHDENKANIPKNQTTTNVTNQTELYSINFITKPGLGLFEGQFRRKLPDGKWITDGVITRINSYGNQSHCVEDKVGRVLLKPYCYCGS